MTEFSIERFMQGNTITLPADFFEFLLACLANQKFIHDVNADGMSEGIDEVRKQQAEMQRIIDIAYRKGWELLMQSKSPREVVVEDGKVGEAGAIFAFMGWLTTRYEVSGPFSAKHDASQAVELVAKFSKMQGWAITDEHWHEHIKPYKESIERPVEGN